VTVLKTLVKEITYRWKTVLFSCGLQATALCYSVRHERPPETDVHYVGQGTAQANSQRPQLEG